MSKWLIDIPKGNQRIVENQPKRMLGIPLNELLWCWEVDGEPTISISFGHMVVHKAQYAAKDINGKSLYDTIILGPNKKQAKKVQRYYSYRVLVNTETGEEQVSKQQE